MESVPRKASPTPFGRLYYDKDELTSLKCLVASRMSKKRAELEAVGEVRPEAMSTPVLFVRADDGTMVHDAFSVSWLLCDPRRVSGTKNGRDVEYEAQILRWHFFSQSEIVPFLTGLLKHSRPKQSQNTLHANRLRKEHLASALGTLNASLQGKDFMVNDRLSLADVSVAVDLIPLMDNRRHFNPLLRDLASRSWAHLRHWYRNVTRHPLFKQGSQHADLAKLAEATYPRRSPTPREHGDSGGSSPSKEGRKGSTPSRPRPAEALPPLKILCLHGYRQNATSFREKTGALRKIIKDRDAEFTFVTAPHRVLPMSNEDINQDQRGWWFSRENDYFKSDDATDCDKGLEASLELIKRTIELHGPFDGLMGFSQGAALAALICLMKTSDSDGLGKGFDFKFAILFAGFKSRCSKHAKWYELDNNNAKKVAIPTMHVIGTEDKVITKKACDELLPCFESPKVVRHHGGHFVPAYGKQKNDYLSFLDEMKELCHGKVPTEKPEKVEAVVDGQMLSSETEKPDGDEKTKGKVPKLSELSADNSAQTVSAEVSSEA